MKVQLRLGGFLLSFAVVLAACVRQAWAFEDKRNIPATPVVQKSDRERLNLRGPVKTLLTETTSPSGTFPDGRQVPEQNGFYRVEFDSDGNMTAQESRGSPEYFIHYVRDASGRLLKVVSGGTREATESVYSYDDQGRLTKITNSRTPDNPVTLHYDEYGRKSMVLVSRPEDYKPGRGPEENSPFTAASVRPPNLPGGGTSTTLYDEFDRPIEAQVRDAEGKLIQRAARSYDAQGNMIEDKDLMENQPATNLPKASAENPDDQDCAEDAPKVFSTFYSYDSKGRLTSRRKRASNEEVLTEFIYNEQGDLATETTKSVEVGGENPRDPSRQEQSSYYETHFDYMYDTYGNWTESIRSFRHSPDGTFERSDQSRRTLTFY